MVFMLPGGAKRVRNFSAKKSKFPSNTRQKGKSTVSYKISSRSGCRSDFRFLEKLISARGVCGDEGEVRGIIEKEIRPYVTDARTDKMGNLIAHKKGVRPKIMLAAHMDEVGLMLKRIDGKGIAYCSGIGGINPVMLLGQAVSIRAAKGVLRGVITCREIWAGKDMEKPPGIEELMIDFGMGRDELLEHGVKIGTYMTLEEKTHYLGDGSIICGKALDDRTGCFTLVELAKRLRNVKNEVYYVFTVQEEFGLYGAKTSAFDIEPDWSIAVDVTHANDVFDEPTRIIGSGPIITIKDGELIANRWLNEKLIEAAKRDKIPYQLAVIEIGTTDATTISVSKGGVPTTVFGIPVRNIHTTVSIAHKSDIENSIRILEEFMKRL